jgi:hypothetical protein
MKLSDLSTVQRLQRRRQERLDEIKRIEGLELHSLSVTCRTPTKIFDYISFDGPIPTTDAAGDAQLLGTSWEFIRTTLVAVLVDDLAQIDAKLRELGVEP